MTLKESRAVAEYIESERLALEKLFIESQARVAALTAALETYGRHHDNCRRSPHYQWPSGVWPDSRHCSCGLDAAGGA